jgi:hypothetical protein
MHQRKFCQSYHSHQKYNFIPVYANILLVFYTSEDLKCPILIFQEFKFFLMIFASSKYY